MINVLNTMRCGFKLASNTIRKAESSRGGFSEAAEDVSTSTIASSASSPSPRPGAERHRVDRQSNHRNTRAVITIDSGMAVRVMNVVRSSAGRGTGSRRRGFRRRLRLRALAMARSIISSAGRISRHADVGGGNGLSSSMAATTWRSIFGCRRLFVDRRITAGPPEKGRRVGAKAELSPVDLRLRDSSDLFEKHGPVLL